ncbi:MAG: ABC transporter permease subunit [Acidisphaera sp.]|nr:ABC transporter permease subunit [Acidisphaera sp.]MBV9812309.1 ABC transporter permease subunit [Acetobacteraceae bacterium]
MVAGFAFLYGPIALLVLTSFNSSRLTTVWTGFSWRWFAALAHDDALIGAAWLSLRIAAVAATGATLLGALAGYALARLGGFRLRLAFAGLLAAPLVLPDLLIALALLLLFVFAQRLFGWPERGAGTITVAHITASLAYVAIVVEARLVGSGAVLEEAAMDLGASAVVAFVRVTLPLLTPALLAGWLLAFTLSLDDVVIASFVSGPGASTLPMVVFSMLHLGATPELNALATVILAVVAVALLAAALLGARRTVAEPGLRS